MKQSTITHIAVLVIALGVGWFALHLNVLDMLLVLYLGIAILFGWSWTMPLVGGVVVGVFYYGMRLVYPTLDISLIAMYPLWLLGAGLFLLFRVWLEERYSEYRESSVPVDGVKNDMDALHRDARVLYSTLFGPWSFMTHARVGVFLAVIGIVLLLHTTLLLSITTALVMGLIIFRWDARVSVALAFGLLIVGGIIYPTNPMVTEMIFQIMYVVLCIACLDHVMRSLWNRYVRTAAPTHP